MTACGEVFEFLFPLEDYFAFPGVTALEQLRASFDRGHSTIWRGRRCGWFA